MHAQTCGDKEVVRELEMINMSASKPMFLDFLLFPSIFLGFNILLVTTCLLRRLFTYDI